MDKKYFLNNYWKNKITLSCFDESKFESDNDIFVKESEASLEEIGDFYCPWYYDRNTMDEMNRGIEAILINPQARAIKISDISKIKSKSRLEKINQYKIQFKNKSVRSLIPFPVAVDRAYGKSLVLDGNHTLVALYHSWDKRTKIPIIQILGESLTSILPEFCMIYRG